MTDTRSGPENTPTVADTLTARGSRLLPSRKELTPEALRTEVVQFAAEVERRGGRGPFGNARLTATSGVVLLALLLAECVTLVSLRPLLSVHVFIGMLLIPPVGLKLTSTGYRFARYYMRNRSYVLAGPPKTVMRMLGPFVIAATMALFGSGIGLIVLGPDHGWVVNLHKASFIAWIVVMSLHVLGHVLHLPGLAVADFRGAQPQREGARLRQAAIASALVAGLILAIATVQYADQWQHVVG
jgi:hypothetical protein